MQRSSPPGFRLVGSVNRSIGRVSFYVRAEAEDKDEKYQDNISVSCFAVTVFLQPWCTKDADALLMKFVSTFELQTTQVLVINVQMMCFFFPCQKRILYTYDYLRITFYYHNSVTQGFLQLQPMMLQGDTCWLGLTDWAPTSCCSPGSCGWNLL